MGYDSNIMLLHFCLAVIVPSFIQNTWNYRQSYLFLIGYAYIGNFYISK